MLISLVFIIEGVIMILAPKKVIKWATSLLEMKDLQRLGLAPLVAGIILLFSASSSAVGWLVVLLGLALIAKAVYIFLTPAAKIKSHPWLSLSDNNYRAFGIVALVLGVILFISRL